MLADPSGYHISQQAGEGVFLPGHVCVGNALHHVCADIFINTRFLERLAPDRVAEPGSQRDNKFEGAGDAQYDAGAAAVIIAFRAVAGIFQCLAGGHQSQQLGGVDRFKHVGRNVELHRIEINRRDEAAPLAVGAVGALLVLIVIVSHLPMCLRDIGYGIDSINDVRPVGLLIVRLREKTADADDGQWY